MYTAISRLVYHLIWNSTKEKPYQLTPTLYMGKHDNQLWPMAVRSPQKPKAYIPVSFSLGREPETGAWVYP